MTKAMKKLNMQAALQDAYGSGIGSSMRGGIISSSSRPRMTSLGGLDGGSKVGDFLKKAHQVIKDNKLVSDIAGKLGAAGVPYASKVSEIAKSLGYGKRRKRRVTKGGSKRGGCAIAGGTSYGIDGGRRRMRTRRRVIKH